MLTRLTLCLLVAGLCIGCATVQTVQPGETPQDVRLKLGDPDEVFFYEGGHETWWVFRPFFGETRLVHFIGERVQAYSPGMIVSDVEASLERSAPR